MKHVWAPWRIEYVRGGKPAGCIFCDKPAENQDVRNYILLRGKTGFVMLNSFPYNPGHLLVACYRHVASPEDLTLAERHEHYDLISRGVVVLKKVYQPDGFNIGANLGKAAGAGVADHFHSHIVPRWNGDTNFMTVVGDIRVVPQALADTYQTLLGKF